MTKTPRKKAEDVVLDVVRRAAAGEVITLSTGHKAKLNVVSGSLFDKVRSAVPRPAIPLVHNDDKNRDEPNPLDPVYLEGVEEFERVSAAAIIDAMLIFGVELVDPIPDDGWEKKLERVGIVVGTAPDERELAFLKYVAVGNADLTTIGQLSNISPEMLGAAAASFRGDN